MEQSVTNITFKGSITEAIMESKRHKKLFVVYLSGEDEISSQLENTTWIDSKVAESILKYCILLHVSQGSTEAVQFSSIYFTDPQTSVPCITVIGYNGMQIWQNEGFVTAETLQSTIDKAWLSLHLQETTASILIAALASKKSEPSSSGISIDGHQGDLGILEDRPTTDPVVVDKELGNKSEAEKSPVSVDTTRSDDKAGMPLSSPLKIVEQSPTIGDNETSHSAKENLVSTEDKKNVNHSQSSEVCEGTSNTVSHEVSGHNQTEDTKTEGNRNVDVPVSDDVSLNIRLPNGTSLRQKFHMTSSLRAVKAYVNENQANSIGSYDLAIPYPRRVFSDKDLSQSLLELGLSNRQALVVVPHQQASGEPRVVNFVREQTGITADASSIANEEGYFSYLRRFLSYFNPLSYIGGRPSSSGSDLGSEDSMRQYGLNRGVEDNLRGAGNPYAGYPQGQNKPEASHSNRKSKQPSNTRFGSNIHTLKHDEDDGRLDATNPFWNGNSTQYNGSGDNNEDGK